MSDEDRVRILVVGDSGVGKTALLSHLCSSHGGHADASGRRASRSSATTWTIGCNVFVRTVETVGVDGSVRKHFVEFIDVGGHSNYKASRHLFYQKLNGVLFVYDLTNVKSYHNLKRWMDELGKANRKSLEGGLEERKTPAIVSPSGLHRRHASQNGMDVQVSFGSERNLTPHHHQGIEMSVTSLDQSLDELMDLRQSNSTDDYRNDINNNSNNSPGMRSNDQFDNTSINLTNANCGTTDSVHRRDSQPSVVAPVTLVDNMSKNLTEVTQRQNKGKYAEVSRAADAAEALSPTGSGATRRGTIFGTLPAFVVGTKCDLVRNKWIKGFSARGVSSGICPALASLDSLYVSAEFDRIEQWNKLVPFLHHVVDHRFFPAEERIREANSARGSVGANGGRAIGTSGRAIYLSIYIYQHVSLKSRRTNNSLFTSLRAIHI
jgi:small GTP-binding protein